MSTIDIPTGAILIVNGTGCLHKGIYLGDDQVAHNSKQTGVVCIEPYSKFSNGKPTQFLQPSEPIDAELLYEKIFPKLGQKYAIFDNNCEHFVSEVLDGLPASDQLKGAATFGALALALGLLTQRSFSEVVQLTVLGISLGISYQNAKLRTVRVQNI